MLFYSQLIGCNLFALLSMWRCGLLSRLFLLLNVLKGPIVTERKTSNGVLGLGKIKNVDTNLLLPKGEELLVAYSQGGS